MSQSSTFTLRQRLCRDVFDTSPCIRKPSKLPEAEYGYCSVRSRIDGARFIHRPENSEKKEHYSRPRLVLQVKKLGQGSTLLHQSANLRLRSQSGSPQFGKLLGFSSVHALLAPGPDYCS